MRKNEEFVEMSDQDIENERNLAEMRKQKSPSGAPMVAMSGDDIDMEGFEDPIKKAQDELKDEV